VLGAAAQGEAVSYEITIDEMAETVGVSQMALHRHGVSKEKALTQSRSGLRRVYFRDALRRKKATDE
jgi:AcrR family transcriptional regulator